MTIGIQAGKPYQILLQGSDASHSNLAFPTDTTFTWECQLTTPGSVGHLEVAPDTLSATLTLDAGSADVIVTATLSGGNVLTATECYVAEGVVVPTALTLVTPDVAGETVTTEPTASPTVG